MHIGRYASLFLLETVMACYSHRSVRPSSGFSLFQHNGSLGKKKGAPEQKCSDFLNFLRNVTILDCE